MKITNLQAIEAQMVLNTVFMSLNLPVSTSLEVARLSTEIDKQVDLFATVRDKLVKQYQIKVKADGKIENAVNCIAPDPKAVEDFTSRIDELAKTETEDIVTKVHFGKGIPDITPENLKPILPFIMYE